jgi:hypothetical protein
MNFALGTGILAAGLGVSALWLRERAYRASGRRELAAEIELGTIPAEHLPILLSLRRFRAAWWPEGEERRLYVRMVRQLVAARTAQRSLGLPEQKLLQVQILTLRTRIRKALGRELVESG